MNDLKNTVFLIFAIFILISCHQDKEQEELLFKQVMDIHDEVMPEMGNLMRLVRKIDASLATSDTFNVDVISVQNDTLLILKNELEEANESMMSWMRQFEQLEKDTPHDQVMLYLENQKAAIQLVKLEVEMAKENTEKYFSEN